MVAMIPVPDKRDTGTTYYLLTPMILFLLAAFCWTATTIIEEI